MLIKAWGHLDRRLDVFPVKCRFTVGFDPQNTSQLKVWIYNALDHRGFEQSIQMQLKPLDSELNSRRTSSAKLRLFWRLWLWEVGGQKFEFLVL